MKSIKHKLTTLAVILTVAVMAQVPQKINYQAVARNASGAVLANTNVSVRFTVHDGSAAGAAVYQETKSSLATNQFGLFTHEIGNGTVVSGAFNTISWGNGDKYLQVEVDPTNGTNYSINGTSQLLSVPYALYAGATGSANANGTINYVSKFKTATSLGNSQIVDDSLAVGIGTGLPLPLNHGAKLTVFTTKDSSVGIYGVYTGNIAGQIGIFGYNNSNSPLNKGNNIGVYGDYNHSRYGIGVVGIGDGGSLLSNDSVLDLGVYGSANIAGYFRAGNGNNPKAIYAVGKVQIVDGTQGAGRVLTSDASGNAYWDTAGANPNIGFGFRGLSTYFVANNTPTDLTFSFKEYDDNNNFSGSIFTVPSNGIYHFDAQAQWYPMSVTTGLHSLQLKVNGVIYTENMQPNSLTYAANNVGVNIKLNKNDTVQLAAFQTSGVSQALNSSQTVRFSGFKVY